MSVNKCILVGNCCADPETRFTAAGKAVTNISLATNQKWKNKETGSQEEAVEFHRLVFFNRLAEIAGEYLKKGSKIYVEGSLRTNKWQDKEGNDRYTTEIIVREMQMLGNKEGQQKEQKEYASSLPSKVTEVDNNKDDGDELIPF